MIYHQFRRRYLEQDYSLSCATTDAETGEPNVLYATFWWINLLVLAIYPLGTPPGHAGAARSLISPPIISRCPHPGSLWFAL